MVLSAIDYKKQIELFRMHHLVLTIQWSLWIQNHKNQIMLKCSQFMV